MKKIAIILTVLFTIILSGCYTSNQRLAKKMIDMYSDDQNYIVLHGEIVEYNDNNIIIKCEDLKTYISYEDETCEYYIHSNRILDLYIGDKIDFVTVPFHFYNGHELPIVKLTSNGNTLLDFNEGKENLIHWVNINFR